MFGDVPSPIAVGALKDSLAPQCAVQGAEAKVPPLVGMDFTRGHAEAVGMCAGGFLVLPSTGLPQNQNKCKPDAGIWY